MIFVIKMFHTGRFQMTISRKMALASVLSAAATLSIVGGGTASAEGDDLYGAIAISKNAVLQLDKSGWATNFPDAASAEAAALDACGTSKCTVVLTFQNTCAALVKRTGRPGWAIAPSQVQAEKNAFGSLGPDEPLSSLSGTLETGSVVRSGCTSNAR
ncbi:DUF4189 domain-containing protein [Nocardia tengchongensis]|uniref:DUF4189 domain-containing protein n=1 Tax=Nocardia tengchongensis TaxID=2055889 RepID=A0ABX8CQ01_9NOCA|nr:DUF4189 domain-containing protein [Nocardia tengchongensis]QVI22011.1 DUF4189 domain-containing protein [Nocardia tengchongensis]